MTTNLDNLRLKKKVDEIENSLLSEAYTKNNKCTPTFALLNFSETDSEIINLWNEFANNLSEDYIYYKTDYKIPYYKKTGDIIVYQYLSTRLTILKNDKIAICENIEVMRYSYENSNIDPCIKLSIYNFGGNEKKVELTKNFIANQGKLYNINVISEIGNDSNVNYITIPSSKIKTFYSYINDFTIDLNTNIMSINAENDNFLLNENNSKDSIYDFGIIPSETSEDLYTLYKTYNGVFPGVSYILPKVPDFSFLNDMPSSNTYTCDGNSSYINSTSTWYPIVESIYQSSNQIHLTKKINSSSSFYSSPWSDSEYYQSTAPITSSISKGYVATGFTKIEITERNELLYAIIIDSYYSSGSAVLIYAATDITKDNSKYVAFRYTTGTYSSYISRYGNMYFNNSYFYEKKINRNLKKGKWYKYYNNEFLEINPEEYGIVLFPLVQDGNSATSFSYDNLFTKFKNVSYDTYTPTSNFINWIETIQDFIPLKNQEKIAELESADLKNKTYDSSAATIQTLQQVISGLQAQINDIINGNLTINATLTTSGYFDIKMPYFKAIQYDDTNVTFTEHQTSGTTDYYTVEFNVTPLLHLATLNNFEIYKPEIDFNNSTKSYFDETSFEASDNGLTGSARVIKIIGKCSVAGYTAFEAGDGTDIVFDEVRLYMRAIDNTIVENNGGE